MHRLLSSAGVESAQALKARHTLATYQVPFSASYLLAMVVNPFAEEGFMRGFLQTRLKQAGWKWISSVLVSASLQTSYHLYQGTQSCLSVGPTFLIFALYYQANRRLWAVIVAHLIMDLLAMIASIKS
jgi:membrane protease YdiL (CAAX protease family)